MASFHLKIVTPDGEFYNGQSEGISLRTIGGDIGILAGHADFVTALGMGLAKVSIDGSARYASCIGGMLTVSRGNVTVVASTFEWADQIDLDRAEAAAQKARAVLENRASYSDEDISFAEASLKRALVRIGAAKFA